MTIIEILFFKLTFHIPKLPRKIITIDYIYVYCQLYVIL